MSNVWKWKCNFVQHLVFESHFGDFLSFTMNTKLMIDQIVTDVNCYFLLNEKGSTLTNYKLQNKNNS